MDGLGYYKATVEKAASNETFFPLLYLIENEWLLISGERKHT